MPPEATQGSSKDEDVEALGRRIVENLFDRQPSSGDVPNELLHRPRPSAEDDDDDGRYRLPRNVQEKIEKAQASQAALKQSYQDFADFSQYFLDVAKMSEAARAAAVVDDPQPTEADESNKPYSQERKQEIRDAMQPVTSQFVDAIGFNELQAKGWEDPTVRFFASASNYAEQRVDWMSRQPEVKTFYNSDLSQVLITECFDLGDGTVSPMDISAACNAKAREDKVTAFTFSIHGLSHRHLSVRECFTYLCCRIANDGFDENVTYPKATTSSQSLLVGLIMSHLRVSEVTFILSGIGHLEHGGGAITEWYNLCKALIGFATRPMPGLKPFRFIILSTERSETVNKIRKECPNIPFLHVLTGAEFRQRYPTGLPKKEKKDKKGKNKKK